MRFPLHPRWPHRLYARLNGYFWHPCPICGRKFGGHEWSAYGYESIPHATRPFSAVAVCPWCAPTVRLAQEIATETGEARVVVVDLS